MIPDKVKYNVITGNSGEKDIHSSLSAMRRNYIWPFLIAIALLIFSEYFFLQEIYGRSNIGVLLLTGIGVTLSLAFIISLIRKYN
jgi:hypothetical protein